MRQWEFFCSMMTGQDGYLSYLSDLCKFPAYHAKHVTTSPDPFGQEATGKATPFVQHAVTFPANSWLQRLRLPNNLYKYLFLLPISICSTPPRELKEVWNLKPPDHDDLLPGIGESRGIWGLRFRIQIRDMFCVAKLILDLHFSSLAVARSPKQKTNHVLDIE